MNVGARLTRLEEVAGDTDRCPECDRRLVKAWADAGLEPPDLTRPVRLYPMRLDGTEPDLTPCPSCGAEPLKLRPMRLDGDVDLTDDDERPASPAGV